jgi:hypothetical protein
MPKWLQAVLGGAEIAGGALLDIYAGGAAGFGNKLIAMGIGTEISALGTLFSKGPVSNKTTTLIQPTAPWEILYGRCCVGGTLIYDYEWGDDNKYRDMVICLADHSCKDVYGLMFDRQRIQIDTTAVPPGVAASSFPAINGGTSFTPVQQTVNIVSISRVNNVVTVTLAADIPLLVVGDRIMIQNVTGDKTLNGTFPVYQILNQVYNPPSPGSVTFTYLCGGQQVSYSNQGECKTMWPDYGRKVYMEVMTGKQSLGQTFAGIIHGTPDDGDTGNLIAPGTGTNPWTSYCSCVGKTVVFLRIHYNQTYFSGGLPQISFLVHGKDDIVDPRTSPPTIGYSENAALCIADFMCDQTWGYKCVPGNDPPSQPGKTLNLTSLINSANICDEAVPVTTPSGSTELRYTINGRFQLSMKRGEILQNMLTACGGRITFDNGSFKIWPAQWPGSNYMGGSTTWRLGAPVIVPPNDGLTRTYTLNWEDQHGGGDQSFGNGTLQLAFDGAAGATMQYLGVNSFTLYTDSYGVLGSGGIVTAGSRGAVVPGTGPGTSGPNAIPAGLIPAPGQELKVAIFSPDGTFYSGPGSYNSDHAAHAYLAGVSDLSLYSFGPSVPIWGPVKWHPTTMRRDLYNGVKGTYIQPANNWQASDFPPYCQNALHGYTTLPSSQYGGDVNLAFDQGDRRWLDIQLPFTISCAAAQRLAKIELLRRRNSGGNGVGTGTLTFNMAGYQIIALDIIPVTFPFFGWNGKLLEVSAHRFLMEPQENGAIALGTQVDVQETASGTYDWNSTEELSPAGYQQSATPSANVAPNGPTNVTAVPGPSVSLNEAGGVGQSTIVVTWTSPADGYVSNGGHFEVQYQLVSTPPSSWIGNSVPSSVNQVTITGLQAGQSYNIQVRAVNAAGVPSPWGNATPYPCVLGGAMAGGWLVNGT